MGFIIVTRRDERRAVVEAEIKKLYWDHYLARPNAFPNALVADVSPVGKLQCAAGVHFGQQGLFSECYLDHPLEQILSRKCGRLVQRNRVVEISTLTAIQPRCVLPFVQRVIEFVELTGAECAVFTATKMLRALLLRSGLNMVELAFAEPGRVKNSNDWGNYYSHDPRVMAVDRLAKFGGKSVAATKSDALAYA